MLRYSSKNWRQFRLEVIEMDGGVCVRCGRGPSAGAILQVHHKQYLVGKAPWDYPYEFCETLCQGCHAREHGKIRPSDGWECMGFDDLGDISGECEVCGTSMRYVFHIVHRKWPSLEVGEVCCDHLTGVTSASDYMRKIQNEKTRRKTFVQSNRWKFDAFGTAHIRQKGLDISIKKNNGFQIVAAGVEGKQRFGELSEAKSFIFDLFENDALANFLRKNAGRLKNSPSP